MLGWEYPPMVNGGLGIACYGLSQALASKTELSFIVPKSAAAPKNIHLIGLNEKQHTHHEAANESVAYSKLIKNYPLDVALDPYQQLTPEEQQTKKIVVKKKKSVSKTKSATTSSSQKTDTSFSFDIKELYGNDLLKNTTLYTELAIAEARDLDFDVIHCHDWMTIPAGIELKKRTGKPLIVQIHSLEYDRSGPESNGLIFQIEKWGMEEADYVVPVSNYTGRIAFSRYGVNPKKLFTIRNGREDIHPYKKEKPFKEPLVVFVGRMTQQKAPLQFIEIAQRVLKKKPNTRFVMAGTGNLLPDTVESGAHYKTGDRIHFTGQLNRGQLFDLMAMADVYCMPSMSEPFGLTALEAVQFKVPCVISAQSGMYELLKGALFADHWNTGAFAEHIVALLSNQKLRAKCVTQATKDIEESTWEHAADRAMTLYDKILH
ncbi:MAG: a-glycosyltransferase-related protein glycosyltransferase family 4 protein [Chitinophagaceae bacterium]|nr:a-glycosyltransferase-related protein glycosyltransferase family 4 protein [Chitinophagaceae bacterium]